MADTERKLVGSLYLDISELEQKVSRANEQLGSIGTGVNLDVTGVVEKQVRSMLESLKNETQRTATQMAQNLSKIGDGFKSSAFHIEHLTTATQRLYNDGSITLTEKGFDKLNRTITDVYRNGQLVSKTLKSDSTLTKDITYANELYAEQVAHLKRIYDLKDQRTKAKDGTDKAHDLDRQLADTERLLEMNNKIIQQLDGQAVARSKLVNLGKEEAKLMQRQDAKAYSGANELAQAQQAYTQLTSSIKGYNQAVKSGNEAGKAYWSQSAQSAAAELDSIEAKVGTLEIEESARKRILDLIQKAKDANLNADAQGLHDTVDKIGNKLVQMLITATALRALKNTWQHAIEYGKRYYDLLNEIRIVSGQTQKQADTLGASYRKMAKDMNVSSTEIAKAAVEFYRQGLPEDETNKRLMATIQYAKISAMSFEDAAKLLTSAVNTMEVSAQRVADVWAYLGKQHCPFAA